MDNEQYKKVPSPEETQPIERPLERGGWEQEVSKSFAEKLNGRLFYAKSGDHEGNLYRFIAVYEEEGKPVMELENMTSGETIVINNKDFKFNPHYDPEKEDPNDPESREYISEDWELVVPKEEQAT